MPLRTQKVSIDFGLGVDEFTDRKLVKEGKLIKAENVHFDGSKNVQKRAGFRTQVMHDLEGNPIEAPDNVFKLKDKPVVFSKNSIYTDGKSDSVSESVRWKKSDAFHLGATVGVRGVGPMPESPDTTQPFAKNISVDQATLSSGVRCVVWGSDDSQDSQDYIGVSVYDSLTGDTLLDSKIRSSDPTVKKYTCVKVIPFGSQGSTPDRFIIMATCKDASSAPVNYYVFSVSIDSNSVPYIEEKGTLSSFMGLPHSVVNLELQDFALLYDEGSSLIYFLECPYDTAVASPWPAAASIYSLRVYRIAEASTVSGFQGMQLASDSIDGSSNTVRSANISAKLRAAPADTIDFALSLNAVIGTVTPTNEVTERVLIGTAQAASIVLGTAMYGKSSPSIANVEEFYYQPDPAVAEQDGFVASKIGLELPTNPAVGRRFLGVHFSCQAEMSAFPSLTESFIGNDYNEYVNINQIDVSTPAVPIINKQVTESLCSLESSLSIFDYGEKKYLGFVLSKKHNRINIADDNFGTHYVCAIEYDTVNHLISRDSHAIAKVLYGSVFCGEKGQLEPRNPSSLEIYNSKLSYASIYYPSLNSKAVNSVEINMDAAQEAIEHDGLMYTSGGFLKVFNGKEYVENNFHFAPTIMWAGGDSAVATDWLFNKDVFKSSGGATADDPIEVIEYSDPTSSSNPTYQFAFTYEWTDADGNLHVSAPSEVVQLQAQQASDKIGLPAGTPLQAKFLVSSVGGAFTEKSNVLLKGYRTLNLASADDPGVALELFLDGSVDASRLEPVDEKKGFNMNAYTFTLSDEELVQKERLYTSNGVLPNIPPPSIERMTSHDGRIFALSSENRSRIYYSKPKLRLSSMEFSDFHYIESTSDGGDINSIASLSGKLFMFKNELTLASYGSPLNESGTSGGYSPPTAFSQSIGCTNPDSVKSTDSGIFFQFYNNIYSIDRSLRLNEVGLDVGDSITSVSSIIHLSDLNELRICHDEGTVIYNTLFKQWYTSSLTTKNNSISVNGRQFCIDKSSLDLLQEDPDYFGDGSTPISTDIETAWIKMSGPQGFQRIRNLLLLGELSADTTFKLELFYDYNTYPSETINITASDIASLASYGGGATYGGTTYYGGNSIDRVFQFRHKPKIQKCESMKLRIVETSLTTPTKGYALNNMLLEVAAKRSGYKLKESKTV